VGLDIFDKKGFKRKCFSFERNGGDFVFWLIAIYTPHSPWFENRRGRARPEKDYSQNPILGRLTHSIQRSNPK